MMCLNKKFYYLILNTKLLQMSTTAAPKNRKLLEREVESKRKDVERLMAYIKPDEEECIRVLVEKKTKKEEEIINCYWFQCMTFKLN